jgi:cob(I)alamin adenosyltransferase
LSAREIVVIVKFSMFSRSTRVRKDGVVIELMGRLDELEALASWTYIETSL